MRYRYITCGTAMPNEPLSNFRLLAQSKMSTSDTAWRVILPDDVKLIKYACDEYSTTEDNRPPVCVSVYPRGPHSQEMAAYAGAGRRQTLRLVSGAA